MLLYGKIRKINSSIVYLEQVRFLAKPTYVIAVRDPSKPSIYGQLMVREYKGDIMVDHMLSSPYLNGLLLS